MRPAVPATAREGTTGGSPMAYITVVLSLTLVVWLALAARAGSTHRVDPASAGDLRAELRRSPDRDSSAPRSAHQLADNRRSGYFAHDEQPARRLRVGEQEQLRVGHLGREVRSHPFEIAA